ncbi:MAG: HyaD/HybD family hydrogenase maturation endopeptidase [Desulfocapsaceae bacterium]|nr:HyaD/HybD family hydrogenase maturation endopeptidase [Desulfocapsaceae bacterium]
MEKTQKKIGIIGIGNLILSDEGFGIHTLHYLEQNYIFPENVILQDAGTAGIYMSPFLEACDPIFVIDVVDLKDEPGSFHFYTMEDVGARNFQTKMSPHQLGLLEIVEICRLRDAAPEHIEFYCVVPQALDTGMELSALVAPRVIEVADKIVKRLQESGVSVQKRETPVEKRNTLYHA